MMGNFDCKYKIWMCMPCCAEMLYSLYCTINLVPSPNIRFQLFEDTLCQTREISMQHIQYNSLQGVHLNVKMSCICYTCWLKPSKTWVIFILLSHYLITYFFPQLIWFLIQKIVSSRQFQSHYRKLPANNTSSRSNLCLRRSLLKKQDGRF